MASICGMLRTAVATPRVHLAHPAKNAQEILSLLKDADAKGASLCVFPELSLTGATCGDLFYQDALLDAARDALVSLLKADIGAAFIVGLPLEMDGRLYDCAAVACGDALAFVPKLWPDSRWFAPGETAPDFVRFGGCDVPVLRGEEAVLACGDFAFGVCVGDDLSAPFSPAAQLCANGALLIANPAAEQERVYGASRRCDRLTFVSRQLACAVAHAGAGFGESTTDAVYGGYAGVFEAGDALAVREGLRREGAVTLADADLSRLRFKRRQSGLYAASFASAAPYALDTPAAKDAGGLLRPASSLPFIPAAQEMDERCREILAIQAQGLLTRLMHIGAAKLVIGVSGGLDSTLALLVAAHACDLAGWPRENIVAITMPGLGTSSRTHDNAESLSSLLSCTALEIPIAPAVAQHFADIGQDPDKHDICYENSQARERTQILMDYANKVGGIVLGTGDLSELALGFCTYNGDQMSMYNVNGSIPKTLMRPLVAVISRDLGADVHRVVMDVVNTPVSPELVPGKEEISQKTEELLGSYDLHDFFLYHMMDSGASPKKLFTLAKHAFAGQFGDDVILKALDTFVRRFFTQQFKRSAMPDGAAATGVSLSPRGGFVAPSDAQRALWVAEVDALKA